VVVLVMIGCMMLMLSRLVWNCISRLLVIMLLLIFSLVSGMLELVFIVWIMLYDWKVAVLSVVRVMCFWLMYCVRLIIMLCVLVC